MTTTKQLLLARPRGFCAGVERAIEIVRIALERYGSPVYVRKEIVHNPYVVTELRSKGAIFVDSETEVPEGSIIVFSAHGVAPIVRRHSRARRHVAIDATCPLVTKVHLEAGKYAKEGYSILLIGHAGHDEIVGTIGEAPAAIQLVENLADAENVHVPDPERVACLTQTTLSLDDTREIVDALRRRFPKLMVRNDICYATQNRQVAVKELAKAVDVILVVGAANSSNSVRLMEVARAHGVVAHRVGDATEVKMDWLRDAQTVGVTSGASTPEVKVAEVLALIREQGFPEAREVEVLEEKVTFALPKGL